MNYNKENIGRIFQSKDLIIDCGCPLKNLLCILKTVYFVSFVKIVYHAGDKKERRTIIYKKCHHIYLSAKLAMLLKLSSDF